MRNLPKIVIVDCFLGNLRSVQKAIETIGAHVLVSNKRDDLEEAEALILPGVGAFRDAANNIEALKPSIYRHVESGKPLLGICLGLQLLFTESHEGGLYSGLDILKGRVTRFPKGLKVPHIGWNTLKIVDATNPLVEGLNNEEYFYFVHSYYASVEDNKSVVALTHYGINFPSIIACAPIQYFLPLHRPAAFATAEFGPSAPTKYSVSFVILVFPSIIKFRRILLLPDNSLFE